jgi:putative membrane protein
MKTLILAAALLAFAAPASAQNAVDQTKNGPKTPSAMTQTFVKNAAITDMFEIQAGQLAQQKADDAAYKDFAQMTITDHTKTTNDIKSMNLGVQPPQELDATHKTKLDKLSALSGAAFERQYKTDQVQGHRQAIAEFERYAKSGDNPDLKKWAQDTLPTLKTHLQHAEALPRPQTAPTEGSGSRR